MHSSSFRPNKWLYDEVQLMLSVSHKLYILKQTNIKFFSMYPKNLEDFQLESVKTYGTASAKLDRDSEQL